MKLRTRIVTTTLVVATLLGAGCTLQQREPLRVDVDLLPPPEFPAIVDQIVQPEGEEEIPGPLVREQIIPPVTEEIGDLWPIRETGMASWYRDRRTASGEPYSRFAFTAAHRTLPFGTLVLVRNLDNEQDVVVRITDRGPFVKGRIIDLSEAAARRVGIYGAGLARVEIEVLILPSLETAQGDGPAEED